MAGMPKRRAKREAAGLPVAPRSNLQFSFNVASLRKMRIDGMDVLSLRQMGMTEQNFHAVMGYEDGTANPDMYTPTGPEREAVEAWVVAGYGAPLKLKDMLLEEFGLDLTVEVIKRAFRIEITLGKERMAVHATKNVIGAIKDGDVPSSFKYLDSQHWKKPNPDGGVPPGHTYNTQIIITAENAQQVYLSLVKGR